LTQSEPIVFGHAGSARRRLVAGDDRGAVAVEFALIFPVLILILVGIVEFGSMYNAQLLVTGAAREAAREMAITGSVSQAQAAGVGEAVGLSPVMTASNISISSPSCSTGQDITVTVTYDKPFLTGMFGTSMALTATATRQCFG
jgi:Flp pilus assembly protein TadG